MPLTKVRYDMLHPEVTDNIKTAVTLSGAGSPLVFETDGSTNTLTKFKVDGADKTIRSVSFQDGLLEIELATFTPVIEAAGQGTLAWDVPASYFTVSANNPDDFTAEWISGIKSPIVQASGSVSTDLSAYTLSGASLPLTVSGDFLPATYTVNSGYVRPVHADVNGTANGGSASGTVTFIHAGAGNNADWGTTKTWSTSWQNVSHSIAHAALSGASFLKTYASTAVTLTVNGLSTATNANCTLTPIGGTISGFTNGANGDRSAQLDFTVPICKDNTGSNRNVQLNTVFSRPIGVTGTAYTYTPTDAYTASTVTASFTYKSFTTWTAGPSTAPNYTNLVDAAGDDGFSTDTAKIPILLGHQATSLSYQPITNSSSDPRTFWFCVRASAIGSKPAVIAGSQTIRNPVAPEDVTEVPFSMRPVSTPTEWTSDVSYKAYGITLYPGVTYVSFN